MPLGSAAFNGIEIFPSHFVSFLISLFFFLSLTRNLLGTGRYKGKKH